MTQDEFRIKLKEQIARDGGGIEGLAFRLRQANSVVRYPTLQRFLHGKAMYAASFALYRTAWEALDGSEKS